jgi:hypothetical protein
MAKKPPRAADSANRWYYHEPGHARPAGPVKLEKLRALIEEGRIHSQSRVWRRGMFRWEALHQVKELNTRRSIFRLAFPLLAQPAERPRVAAGS